MATVFEALRPTTIPIANSNHQFPLRRIYCVGRNYEDHAREMGLSEREPPFFFTKWPDTYVPSGATVPYPLATNAFHFEVELVVAIGRGGCAIDTDKAADHVFGLAVGLDMTRRDLQLQARQTGRPWDTGKNFDNSAPIGMIHRLNNDSPMDRGRIWLERNGTVVQDANVSQLTWSVSEVISHLSRLYPLAAGDLIMTGTPAGVGSVEPGDHLIGHIEGLTSIEIRIGPVAN